MDFHTQITISYQKHMVVSLFLYNHITLHCMYFSQRATMVMDSPLSLQVADGQAQTHLGREDNTVPF